MLKKFFIYIIIFISGSGISDAQQEKIYTLDEAISTAFRNNSELINSRLDKLKAEQKVNEVYNESLLPTITLNSNYSRAFKKQVFDIFGQRYVIGTDNAITNTLSVIEPIPVLGTPVFQGINIARYYENLQNENIASVEAKITGDVKNAYYNVLFLKEVLNNEKANLQNAEENLNVVQKRFNNGTITEFDLLRAKVTVENIRPQILEAESNLIISRKSLKNSIGNKDDIAIDVTGTLDYDSTEVFGNPDDLILRIASNNVAIRQLNISRNINSEIVDIDNSNYLPKLFVFGQYNLNAAEDDGRSFFNYRYFSVLNAGIGLSWNLNLFRNTYKKNQSIIDVKKTDESIADTKQKLKLLSQSVLLKIEESRKRIIATKETVKLAERGYELAEISLKNGVINQIDLIDAGLRLSQSKLAYYSAIREYLLARTELEVLLEKK